jgi:hypothetical protein
MTMKDNNNKMFLILFASIKILLAVDTGMMFIN